MDEREIARAEIDHSRERIKDIAIELVHRTKPTYVKQKAKEAAVHKTVELKDKVVGSPAALGIIGGLATAVVAKRVIAHRDRDARSFEDHTYYETRANVPQSGLENEAGGAVDDIKARVHDKLDDAKHAAGELKEKAARGVARVREHIPTRDEVKAKAHDVRVRAGEYATKASEYASREPMLTALGALAIGAALGFLLPLSSRERRVLAPARDQVAQKLESLGGDVNERLQQKVDELHDKIAGDTQQDGKALDEGADGKDGTAGGGNNIPPYTGGV